MLVKDFIQVCEALWPASGADEWDRPGLSVGSLEESLKGVLLSVDVTHEVIEEAIALGLNLVLSHHPLMLRGVTSVSDQSPKGELLVKAIRAGVAVFSAHTNADIVEDGVSDTIAKKLGLVDLRPLVATHGSAGHGRIGRLAQPTNLADLVATLTRLLPATTRGISASASEDTPVEFVALCGGAGDAFIDAAKDASADVYITSDLRHHVTQEAGLPLVDVSHWASESLWLEVAAKQLSTQLPGLKVSVSAVSTDPWVFNAGRTK